MQKQLLTLLLAASLQGLAGFATSAHASTYAGNGGNGFGGDVGSGGMLGVTDDGSGGLIFSFALANSATNFNGTNNDLVIYIDNGKGGGIGTSTANLTDTGDNSRIPVSEYDGTDRSTLSFGTLMSPQYGIDLSSGQANIFTLVNNTAAYGFGYDGGSALGSTTGGVTYSLTSSTTGSTTTSTYSLDVPTTDLGLTSYSGATLKFLAINVSNTGFSSNEATVALTGSSGYANTQTIGAVNSFTAAPEPGTWATVLLGGFGMLAVARHRKRLAR